MAADRRCVTISLPEQGLSKEDLRDYFTSFDPQVAIVMKSKKEALVTFNTDEVASQVLTTKMHSVKGHSINVKKKYPEPFESVEVHLNPFWVKKLELIQPILAKVADETDCIVQHSESEILLKGNFYQIKQSHRMLEEEFSKLDLDDLPPTCFTPEDEREIESFEHVEKHDLQQEFDDPLFEKSEKAEVKLETERAASKTSSHPSEMLKMDRKGINVSASGTENTKPIEHSPVETMAKREREPKRALFEKSVPFEDDDLPSPVVGSGKKSPLDASLIRRSGSEDEHELCIDHHLWLYIRCIMVSILAQIQDKFKVIFVPLFGENPSYDIIHIEADKHSPTESALLRKSQANEEFVQLYQKLAEELLVTSEKVPGTPDMCRQAVLDVVDELSSKYLNVAFEYNEESNTCYLIGRPLFALQARDEFVKILKERLPEEVFENYQRRDQFTVDDILDHGRPNDEIGREDPTHTENQTEIQESVHEKHFISCVQDMKMTDDSVLRINFVTNFTVLVYTGDIVAENVDVIVSAANGFLANAGGVAAAISDAAGRMLDRACDQIMMERSDPIPVTENVVTTAGDLKAKYVMHAVGPQLRNFPDDAERLQNLKLTFVNIFRRADELKLATVALPAISAGIFGVPMDDVALALFSAINHVAKRRHSGGRYSHLREIRVLNNVPEGTNIIQDIFMKESVAVPLHPEQNLEGPVTEIEVAVQKLLEKGDARTQEVINELLDETERIGQLEHQKSRRGRMVESIFDDEPGCKTHGRTEEEATAAMRYQKSRPQRTKENQYGKVEPGCKTHHRTEDEAPFHGMKHHKSPKSPRRHQSPHVDPAFKTFGRKEEEFRRSGPQPQPQHVLSPKTTTRPVKNIGQVCAFCSFDHNLMRLSCGHILCRPCLESIPEDHLGHHPCPFCPGKRPAAAKLAPEATPAAANREPEKARKVPGQVYDLPGNLRHVTDDRQLPDWRGYCTIILHIDVPDGVQKRSHPYPGRPYKGIKVTSYLPDTPEGRQVLSMLYECFKAGKMFRVVRSKSSSMDVVVSNVTFKTDVYGENGYPDPEYLPKLKEYLHSLGMGLQ